MQSRSHRRDIETISSLAIFPHLTCLGIDGNHIQTLDCVIDNLALAELYAGNNHISSIKGSLEQLTNLRVLHLQNNQISNLTNLIDELRHLCALEDLSTYAVQTKSTDNHTVFPLDLFDNPVTFARDYRSTMIDLFPKLRVLDRKSTKANDVDAKLNARSSCLAISSTERAQAFNVRQVDRRKVLDRMAFESHLRAKDNHDSMTQKRPAARTLTTSRSAVTVNKHKRRVESSE